MEEVRNHVEGLLHAVTLEAESWATEGTMRAGERGFYPVPQGAIEI